MISKAGAVELMQARLADIQEYLRLVVAGKLPVNHDILYDLQVGFHCRSLECSSPGRVAVFVRPMLLQCHCFRRTHWLTCIAPLCKILLHHQAAAMQVPVLDAPYFPLPRMCSTCCQT